MSNLKVRQQIQSYIEQLSEEKLIVVADFLAYLVEKEDNEATKKLLNIVGFENDLKEEVDDDEYISSEELQQSESAWKDYISGKDKGINSQELKRQLLGEDFA
ncbi:hypothetical protein [Cyanothece sp. BG0011]|uniref:hypothetical protein n=1 Tax=Cyanothece sp. BG0011 TaxID=2082950 RepID=UPI000D1E69D8|nr:hypothetical protein [Cyanothece sp. BG0011]